MNYRVAKWERTLREKANGYSEVSGPVELLLRHSRLRANFAIRVAVRNKVNETAPQTSFCRAIASLRRMIHYSSINRRTQRRLYAGSKCAGTRVRSIMTTTRGQRRSRDSTPTVRASCFTPTARWPFESAGQKSGTVIELHLHRERAIYAASRRIINRRERSGLNKSPLSISRRRVHGVHARRQRRIGNREGVAGPGDIRHDGPRRRLRRGRRGEVRNN